MQGDYEFQELMLSKNWRKLEIESDEDFFDRKISMMASFKNQIKGRGLPILIALPDGTIRVSYASEWNMTAERDKALMQNDTHIETITKEDGETIQRKVWHCPICKHGTPYMMRVVNPRYQEGFLDKGGVLSQCLCVRVRTKDRVIEKQTGGKVRLSAEQ